MIQTFKETNIRDTAIVNKGMFEQIKLLHSQNPQLAGELAISFIELVLTGEYSSDDFMIQFALANHKIIAEKNALKYDKKVEADKQATIEKQHLEEIAEMYKEGYTQKEMAEILNTAQSTISKRLKLIRTDYAYLLENAEDLNEYSKSNKIFQNSILSTYDNENENENYNDNENYFSAAYATEIGAEPQAPEQELEDFENWDPPSIRR